METETKNPALQEMTENMANTLGGRVVLSSKKMRPMVIKKYRGVSYSIMFISNGMWRIGERSHGVETIYDLCSASQVKDIFNGIENGEDIPLRVYKKQ